MREDRQRSEPEETSDKTLHEIEKEEGTIDIEDDSRSPSPDGAFDEPSQNEKAGPM